MVSAHPRLGSRADRRSVWRRLCGARTAEHDVDLRVWLEVDVSHPGRFIHRRRSHRHVTGEESTLDVSAAAIGIHSARVAIVAGRHSYVADATNIDLLCALG